jgi:hypothetical protein
MSNRGSAYRASALALASAALSVYWTAGGTFLLDTVGGSIEDTGRAHSSAAILLGTMTALAKLGAALLALALVRPRGHRIPDRLRAGGNTLMSVLLVGWCAASVVLGTLALAGVISGAVAGDQRALLWHVLVWDPWFLLWGVVLALAIAHYRRTGRRGYTDGTPKCHDMAAASVSEAPDGRGQTNRRGRAPRRVHLTSAAGPRCST